MYNFKKRSGFLFDKVRNKNRKEKPSLPFENELNEEEIENYNLFFQHCVVNNDRDEIRKSLQATVNYRKMCNQNDFDKIYDFYFADPTLVIINIFVRRIIFKQHCF